MTIGPADLLKMLGAGSAPVRSGAPAGSGTGVGGSPAGVEHASFDELLKKAQAGGITTDLPVEVDRDANVQLSDDQLKRLTLAADQAEAAGLHTALVMIDGMSLVMDVHSRRITRQVDLKSGVLSGIDGLIAVPGIEGQAAGDTAGPAKAGLLKLQGASTPGNASLAKVLAAAEQGRQAGPGSPAIPA